MNKKKNKPHEKPISIHLNFMDAIKQILSAKPEKKKRDKNSGTHTQIGTDI